MTGHHCDHKPPGTVPPGNKAPRGERSVLAMSLRAARRTLRGAVVCLFAGSLVFAAEGTSPGPRRPRRLWGADRRAAREARDLADISRAAFEKRYRRKDSMPAGEDEAAAEIVAAYEDVITKWPDSKIAAYCGIRLAGFHQFRRDYAKASATAEKVARAFPGTVHEMDAYFTIGLMHLQALHDPAAAIPWFAKIQPPPGADENGVVSDEKYDEAHSLYLSVQLQLAGCEAMVGQVAEAKERHEQLVRRYPQYAYHIRSAGKAMLLYAEAYRARPATGKRDPIQPGRLVTRGLTERTPLDALLADNGSAEGQTEGPTEPSAPRKPKPSGLPLTEHRPGSEAQAESARAVGETAGSARSRTYRLLALCCAGLGTACAGGLLFLHRCRSQTGRRAERG